MNGAAARKFPSLWVEVNPPRGIATAPLLHRLAALRTVAGVNVTDNALAKVKMSALVFAAIVKQSLGLPVMLNFTCRDRNLLALKADLLGAAAIGLDAVVALAGDKLAPGAAASGVYDVDTMGLLRVIGELNRSDTGEGNASLKVFPALHAGAVANPNRADWNRELVLLERKVEAGARFVVTQPVFNSQVALRFLEGARRLPVRVIMGILPIKSPAMARYLKQRIKDLKAVAGYFDCYETLNEEEARHWSLMHCQELMETLCPHVAGFNIMSGGAPSLSIELALTYARRLQPGARAEKPSY